MDCPKFVVSLGAVALEEAVTGSRNTAFGDGVLHHDSPIPPMVDRGWHRSPDPAMVDVVGTGPPGARQLAILWRRCRQFSCRRRAGIQKEGKH